MSHSKYAEMPRVTWETVAGCTPVGPGCTNCYAARQVATVRRNDDGYNGLAVLNPHGSARWLNKVRLLPERLGDIAKLTTPSMVYCNLLSDTFHEDVPFDYIDNIVDVVAAHPQHVFQFLTRRDLRINEYLGSHIPPRNTWWGVSIESIDQMGRRFGICKSDDSIRFLSLEPLLGDVGTLDLKGIAFVMVGLECGPGARRGEHQWVRNVVNQCHAVGVPVQVEQLNPEDDSREHWPADLQCDEWPEPR